MSILSGFWHAAARMTGRIDFSTAVQRLPPGTSLDEQSDAFLRDAGLDEAKIRILRRTPSFECESPWIRLDHSSYPSLLRILPFAPPVLFYRGAPGRLADRSLAIVGARQSTSAGNGLARCFSGAAVNSGLVVVSGLAQGIDTAAHLGAKGRTLAVLGNGLEYSMSEGRARLANQIVAEGGLLISEFLPHFPASKWTFPQRNRVIAGLCEATLVVEATRRSGALITARHALEIGREVLSVPGHPGHPLAQGCLQLLRDGAQMVASVEDLEDAMGLRSLESRPKSILRELNGGFSAEDLSRSTGRPVLEIHRELAQALVAGRVRRLPGDRYIRNAED
jgi:DNA processing protein